MPLMMDAPNCLTIDPLLVMPYPLDHEKINETLDEETRKLLTQSFLASIETSLKTRAILRLEEQGFDVSDLAEHLGMNASRLKASFRDRIVAWEYIYAAYKLACLDPKLIDHDPTGAESLNALSNAVIAFHHADETLDCSHSAAMRVPIEAIPLDEAALIHALIENDPDRWQWIELSIEFAKDFESAEASVDLKQYVTDIFTKATVIVSHNEATCELLRQASPKSVPLSQSLRLIAQVWNPFQSHWRVAEVALATLIAPFPED